MNSRVERVERDGMDSRVEEIRGLAAQVGHYTAQSSLHYPQIAKRFNAIVSFSSHSSTTKDHLA